LLKKKHNPRHGLDYIRSLSTATNSLPNNVALALLPNVISVFIDLLKNHCLWFLKL